MKRKLASFFLLCLLLIATGCGVSSEEQIYRLNDRFCDSFNHMDIEGMLDCVEPSVAESINAIIDMSIGLAGTLAGVDIDLDAQTMYALAKAFFEFTPESEWDEMGIPQIDMQVDSIQFNETGDQAVGNVTLTLSTDSQSQTETGQAVYVLSDGEWYFYGLSFTQ